MRQIPSMIKLFLFLLFLLCSSIFSYGQVQRNYAQELFNLLMNGRCFEAKEFKSQHQNQLPPGIDLIYNMYMSSAFNNPDNTIHYYEEFLGDPQRVRTIGPIVGRYYIGLYDTYASKQQFEKAISTVERHINYLKENPYSLDPELIRKEIGEAENNIALFKDKLNNGPLRRIVRDGKVHKIKLKDDPCIRFDALYNGHNIETYFDKGITEFCSMEKELADEIGVKYTTKQDSARLMYGKMTRAIGGYIDSIELGGIKLYNIPVVVFLDKFTSHLPEHLNLDVKQDLGNNLLKSRQVLFGLPAIRVIGGRFEFDWKSNTLTIQQIKDSKKNPSNLNPNMAFINNSLYVNMKINDTDFTGFLDLSSDHYLFLTYPYFFKSNSDYVKYDPRKRPYTRFGLLGIEENIERYRLENPHIYFDGRKIDFTKPQREVYTVVDINNFDGEVGVRFFKNTFSKTIIDFDSMTIECED